MSLNSTPSSERTHIGIFGRRNAGKSSLINAQKIYMLKKNLWIFHEKKKNLDMHLFFHGK